MDHYRRHYEELYNRLGIEDYGLPTELLGLYAMGIIKLPGHHY